MVQGEKVRGEGNKVLGFKIIPYNNLPLTHMCFPVWERRCGSIVGGPAASPSPGDPGDTNLRHTSINASLTERY